MEKIPGTEKRTERGRKGGGINHERKEEIIDFYDKIYKNDRRNVAKAIRDMARKYIDIETTMQPICVYIDKE